MFIPIWECISFPRRAAASRIDRISILTRGRSVAIVHSEASSASSALRGAFGGGGGIADDGDGFAEPPGLSRERLALPEEFGCGRALWLPLAWRPMRLLFGAI
jgi:hypothetical protein